MLQTVWAVVRDGKVELLHALPLPEGARVLVTVLNDDDQAFWQHASSATLDQVWLNTEDDVYAELLAV